MKFPPERRDPTDLLDGHAEEHNDAVRDLRRHSEAVRRLARGLRGTWSVAHDAGDRARAGFGLAVVAVVLSVAALVAAVLALSGVGGGG